MEKEKAKKEQEINELKQNLEKQSMNARQQYQDQLREYQEEEDRKEAIRQKELEAARREQELLIKNASRHHTGSAPSPGAWDNNRRNVNGYYNQNRTANTHHHEHNSRNRERNPNREYYPNHPQADMHNRQVPNDHHHSSTPIEARLDKIERTQESILEKIGRLFTQILQ